MGIFNLFKSKTKEISFEELLQKATTEPSYRASFYKRIVDEELIVLTQKSSFKEGVQTAEEGTKIQVLTLEDGVIPIFTAKERILDKNIITKETSYIQLKGMALFEMTKGAAFILNPYSSFSKELLPNEISGILNGTLIGDNHQQITIKTQTKVQIAQPAVYPTELVASLKILFANKPNVEAAYLGWIFYPDSGEPAHYIFGIKAKGDYEDIINEAGFAVKEYVKKPDFVDFIRIENGDSMSMTKYFINETVPFYSKGNN